MKILILEDNTDRVILFDKWLSAYLPAYVSNAKLCIHLLETKEWDVLFLDHDLGGEEMVSSGPGTGYEVAQWLCEHPERIPGQVILHSLNPVGRKNMYDILSKVTSVVENAPGCWIR